jgi:putative tricarboxylic transport membrane protein
MGGISAAVAFWRRTVIATLGAAIFASPAAAQSMSQPLRSPHMDRLTLIVPAAVGGGWDLTAKAMKAALEREGLVGQVSIVRYPGAGGLIGLSQFISHDRGKDDILLIGGLVMLGSALRDEAAVTMRDVTPIARLTGEWDVLAAPATSSVHSVADIRQAMARDPAKVRWVGGALGGPDQGLVYSIAQRLGVGVDDIEYYGRAGGRRVTETLLEGRGDVGISGYAEFQPYATTHALNILAVAAPHRLAGIDVPTLRELGIDATMMNWRAVFAAPGISAAQQDRLAGLVAAMAHSPSWRAQLGSQHWTDAYLEGISLSQFIDREQTRWAGIINPPRRAGDFAVEQGSWWSTRTDAIIGALALLTLAVVAAWLALDLRRRRRMTRELESRCRALAVQLDQAPTSAGAMVKTVIDDDFQEWRLSDAESDIAWFMLRGLPLREIADVRGTSERTVRQQAQSIYRKAGLDGRSDLAGRVLERFI